MQPPPRQQWDEPPSRQKPAKPALPLDASSNIGYQKWAFVIYLMAVNLKGTSSMHLHRDLDITQKSAWFMAHRIKDRLEAGRSLYDGPRGSGRGVPGR